jgi:hypothetical protein
LYVKIQGRLRCNLLAKEQAYEELSAAAESRRSNDASELVEGLFFLLPVEWLVIG